MQLCCHAIIMWCSLMGISSCIRSSFDLCTDPTRIRSTHSSTNHIRSSLDAHRSDTHPLVAQFDGPHSLVARRAQVRHASARRTVRRTTFARRSTRTGPTRIRSSHNSTDHIRSSLAAHNDTHPLVAQFDGPHSLVARRTQLTQRHVVANSHFAHSLVNIIEHEKRPKGAWTSGIFL